ncbi:MAG TPA: Tat proofreading chaperone DmsD [Providencia sp.]|uniref:Tat proofreading chaperone DmsD n=1 Tax=Providencia sp. TaxID=589 RepID=UPI000E98626F|nr:Tat proofreading chaperone DmsD [Providencia sp.]HBO24346.1 Tat proofreading chaperone DmsD [Providencia sp.]
MSEQSLNNISLTARVLGAAFYYSPSAIQDIVTLLSSNAWVESWPYESLELKQSIATELAIIETENESLDEAYQRLFIGPYALPSPPWGSVWLDNEKVLFGDSTVQLRDWMQQNKIDIHLAQNEPEDHIGLLFMMVAWVAENCPSKLPELLADHILPWSFLYLDKLQQNADFLFYTGLAKLANYSLISWQRDLNMHEFTVV